MGYTSSAATPINSWGMTDATCVQVNKRKAPLSFSRNVDGKTSCYASLLWSGCWKVVNWSDYLQVMMPSFWKLFFTGGFCSNLDSLELFPPLPLCDFLYHWHLSLSNWHRSWTVPLPQCFTPPFFFGSPSPDLRQGCFPKSSGQKDFPVQLIVGYAPSSMDRFRSVLCHQWKINPSGQKKKYKMSRGFYKCSLKIVMGLDSPRLMSHLLGFYMSFYVVSWTRSCCRTSLDIPWEHCPWVFPTYRPCPGHTLWDRYKCGSSIRSVLVYINLAPVNAIAQVAQSSYIPMISR